MGITIAHHIFWLSLKLCNILELNSTKYATVDIVMFNINSLHFCASVFCSRAYGRYSMLN